MLYLGYCYDYNIMGRCFAVFYTGLQSLHFFFFLIKHKFSLGVLLCLNSSVAAHVNALTIDSGIIQISPPAALLTLAKTQSA